MVTDTTAARLARDAIAYREMLAVALALLAAAQQQLAVRERTIGEMREDIQRYMRREVQA